MDIEDIRKCVREGNIQWTIHCQDRLEQRGISTDDVLNCILTGEIIREYSETKPRPSCLIYGYDMKKSVLHVVVGYDKKYGYCITAYYPSLEIFKEDLKTRR